MTKSVAIFGFAPQTRGLIKKSDAKEVWTMNNFYNYGLPEERVTRTFEMHQLFMSYFKVDKENKAALQYWHWMKEPHPFPIYMLKNRQDFVDDFERIKTLYNAGPEKLTEQEKIRLGDELRMVDIGIDFFQDNNADIRKFPLQECIDDTIPILPHIPVDTFPQRGMEPYYISSIDYMLALAIYERFERIELYGVELREKTEWAMQKSGATFWCGFARGRGIEVWVPRVSVLISAPLYGLEGGDQLIPIQVPEHLKKQMTVEFDKHRNAHNHATGIFHATQEELNRLKAPMQHDERAQKLSRMIGSLKTNLNSGKCKEPEKVQAKIEKFEKELIDRHDKLTERAKVDIPRLQKKLDKLRLQIANSIQKMNMAEGAMNICNYLIDHENMKMEPLKLESITRIDKVIYGDDGEVVETEPDVKEEEEQEPEAVTGDMVCSYCGFQNPETDADGKCVHCMGEVKPVEKVAEHG